MKQAREIAAGTSPAAILYQQHAAKIFAYLLHRAPSREDAEDLLLDVFIAAFEQEHLAAVPEEARLAWLRTVASHKLIDHYRRSGRRPAVPLEQVDEAIFADDTLDPERITLHHEEQNDIWAALQRLPVMQQEVLRLRFGAGLRAAQIAARLNKSEAAVRMLLFRALNLLRARCGEHEGGGSL